MNTTKLSVHNHQDVPADYYQQSIKTNLGQRFWHYSRFRQVLSLVKYDPKAIILDIGSADGTFSKVVFDKVKPKKLIGIDVLRSSVRYSNKRFKRNKKMTFKVADAHKLPFKDESFTAAICLEVLEHIFKPAAVIKEIKRVLKPGGYAIALVPSENFLFKVIWWVWKKGKGRIWKEAHVQDFGKDSLKDVFLKQGFTLSVERYFLLGMLYVIKVTKPLTDKD